MALEKKTDKDKKDRERNSCQTVLTYCFLEPSITKMLSLNWCVCACICVCVLICVCAYGCRWCLVARGTCGAVWGFWSPHTLFTAVCMGEPAGKRIHPNTNLPLLRLDRTKLDRAPLSPSHITLNASDRTQLTNRLYEHGSMIQLRQHAQKLMHIQTF